MFPNNIKHLLGLPCTFRNLYAFYEDSEKDSEYCRTYYAINFVRSVVKYFNNVGWKQ